MSAAPYRLIDIGITSEQLKEEVQKKASQTRNPVIFVPDRLQCVCFEPNREE